jgi:hypothetical protein
MAFNSETEMFDLALSNDFFKGHPFISPNSSFYIEPKGLFGIPDLVIATIDPDTITGNPISVYAFEFKLKNWKQALMQAFRYKSFANYSFVIMDNDFIDPAIKNYTSFLRANIGLLSIDDHGKIIKHVDTRSDLPYSKGIRNKVEQMYLDTITKERYKNTPISPTSLTNINNFTTSLQILAQIPSTKYFKFYANTEYGEVKYSRGKTTDIEVIDLSYEDAAFQKNNKHTRQNKIPV